MSGLLNLPLSIEQAKTILTAIEVVLEVHISEVMLWGDIQDYKVAESFKSDLKQLRAQLIGFISCQNE